MDHSSDVQSLLRGLRVLEVVNALPGSCVSEIAVKCQLPRTSTHRLLNTLTHNGFARRDDRTQRYFPTQRVLHLACGFDRAAHLAERARLLLQELSGSISWPMHFSTQDHLTMQIGASTDHVSPLAVEKLLPGQRIPLLQCAAGLAWLASQPGEERRKIVEAEIAKRGEVVWNRPQLESALLETQRRGFAVFRRPQRCTVMVGLSVPVRIEGEVQAALSVRFAESAIPISCAREKFLPALAAAATRLSDAPH